MHDLDQKSFYGIGYDTSLVAIDILPIYQLSSFIPNLSLLITDEFIKMNGLNEALVKYGKDNLVNTLDKFKKIYGLDPKIILCSDFMKEEDYKNCFNTIKDTINQDKALTEIVKDTVPKNKQHIASALDYPVHEFACVQYLYNKGYSLKIGPSREYIYDRIMELLNFKTTFIYTMDSFALGTKTVDLVVPYIPSSKGPNNGQRIYIGDPEYKVKLKLAQGCDTALRYFCRIASVSGYLLKKDYFSSDEISLMYGKKLKKETTKLVLNNIIKPLQGEI